MRTRLLDWLCVMTMFLGPLPLRARGFFCSLSSSKFLTRRPRYHSPCFGVQSRSISSLTAEKPRGNTQQFGDNRATRSSDRPSLAIFYNDVYHVQLPPHHRFPMAKYGQVRRRVQDYVQQQQQQQSSLSAVDCTFLKSPLATVQELETTHDPHYIARYLRGDMTEQEQRNVGFPWSLAGVNRTLSSVGGTVAAARHVVVQTNDTTRWAAHVAGGTHHAFYDYGEGFCVFSDMAVAANVVFQEFPDQVQRILMIDLDVHQGNGNAVLFQNRSDVFAFSMHCSANYFSPKQTSDLDIELPIDCRDETYLMTLQHWLTRIHREATPAFDLVFFQAGVDGLHEDRLGRMALTAKGLEQRNNMVYEFCAQQNLPLVICMGGGYPRSDWEPILASHAAVYTGAFDFLQTQASARDEAATTTATTRTVSAAQA